MRRRLVILGSTGSIGTSTLDVASRHPDRFEVVGLSAFTRIPDLARQCLRWQPRWAVVPDDSKAMQLRTALAGQARTEVCVGATALAQMAREPEVDCVMAAIVGAAGLDACMAAARAGKRLLLANKEALLVGGAWLQPARSMKERKPPAMNCGRANAQVDRSTHPGAQSDGATTDRRSRCSRY